jgi:hypothetical protein
MSGIGVGAFWTSIAAFYIINPNNEHSFIEEINP